MAKNSKRYRSLPTRSTTRRSCRWTEAVQLLKTFNTTKFDQTVEIAMRLGIDPKQADQIVRGSIVLPHGIGKTQRVVVFAKGDMAEAARRPAPTKSAGGSGQEDQGRLDRTSTSASPRRT